MSSISPPLIYGKGFCFCVAWKQDAKPVPVTAYEDWQALLQLRPSVRCIVDTKATTLEVACPIIARETKLACRSALWENLALSKH
ncbi:hypothetical protein K466DRAFT_607416 [Polyporus arcularius HHB13444]|uniref:Uncharacterized protein n=1 Tax=Polyporus arcularius HHB13444 TaxID=1314778 RepID=A0A5C3NLC0_9APHY|nr:hypothetical protein K466DRAFT_607416 [Polyporus arcularius HHB13444]